MKDKERIKLPENKIEELKDVLNRINKIIYAQGLSLGSDDYFIVRGLCVDTVRETDMRMVESWEVKMKVFLFADDMETLFVRPKEQGWDEESLRDVPKDLIDRYKAVEAEYITVQKLLRPYWEGK